MKKLKYFSLILLITLFLITLSPSLSKPLLSNNTQHNLIEQGKVFYDSGRFAEAINL